MIIRELILLYLCRRGLPFRDMIGLDVEYISKRGLSLEDPLADSTAREGDFLGRLQIDILHHDWRCPGSPSTQNQSPSSDAIEMLSAGDLGGEYHCTIFLIELCRTHR